MIKKYNVICFINSAGINVIPENIQDTMVSIKNNINTNFAFYICTDTDDRKLMIEKIAEKNNLNNYILEIDVKKDSWANTFNNFFNKYKNHTDYILSSHDDLIVRTFDFFNITMSEIEGKEDEIGWIGYTSDAYYRLGGNPVCQSAREMFCQDRFNWPKTYELHNVTDKYDESLLDMPSRSCIVSGIFSHFNLIKTTNLEKIGLCPNWGNYTLLIDEHWSLKTLINNMWTVWVPQVFYDHPIRGNMRVTSELQNQHYVEMQFYKLWGYNYLTTLTDEIIESVCRRFPNTNIGFFNNKKTYEYQYLKN